MFEIPPLYPLNILQETDPLNFIRTDKTFCLKGKGPGETHVPVPRTVKGSSPLTCSNILRRAIISSTCQDDEKRV